MAKDKNKWVLMLLSVLIAIAYLGYRKYQFREVSIPAENSLHAASVTPEKFDPCFKKNQCLTIYVAPWCSVCKQQLPEYLELAKRLESSHYGVRYLVGDSTPARNLSTAQQWKSGSFSGLVDDTGFALQYKTEIFPSFYIHDQTGKITHQGSQAWAIAQSWKPN